MQEYGELKVTFHYRPERDQDLRTVEHSFTSPDGDCEVVPGPASRALTKLAKDGWRLVTSVGMQYLATGGDQRLPIASSAPQIIHTLVRTVKDAPTEPI